MVVGCDYGVVVGMVVGDIVVVVVPYLMSMTCYAHALPPPHPHHPL